MFKMLLSTAILAAVTGSAAFAADLPVRKAPPPPMAVFAPAFSWTGFYVGLNGGWGAGSTNPFDFAAGAAAQHDVSGGFLGATLGYNYQMPSNLVLGVEADGDWSNIGGSTTCPSAVYTCSSKVNSFFSARARAGFAVDHLLIFATGGAAISNNQYRTYTTATGVDWGTPYSYSPMGWVVGGGFEYAITNNVTAKVEYDYYGFQNSTAGAGTLGVSATNLGTNFGVGKVGVNFKF